ncbi:MAG: outer membrane protein transport protein [Burkholderiales bacterium]
MTISKKLFALTPLCALLAAGSAHATNGMLMEGYGPISTGMGGASQAFDHGTAAMAQNPATLALGSGEARLDIALGFLGPKVTSSVPGMPEAPSGGTAYTMPAVGYTARSGALTYGVGMFAQGGMGTEYGANTFMAMGSGDAVRSELSVGNVIIPLAYQVNSSVTVGATVDYMWSGLDLQMAASPQDLGRMVTGGTGQLGGAIGSGALNTATWARVNFTDTDKFTGAAKATGWGAKLGATFKISKDTTLGASYRLKSALDDMKTGNGSASMTANPGRASFATFGDTGQMTVINFQMPSVLAIGGSWQVQPDLMLVADIKSIGWAEVMKSFKMRYDSGAMGGSVSFELPQNWKDQTVLNLGLAWKTSEQLTIRAGLNLADNPIPDATVNPLFPATVKSHATLGFGYQASPTDSLNAALTVAPSTSVTSGTGVTISHGQTNMQLMYTHRF